MSKFFNSGFTPQEQDIFSPEPPEVVTQSELESIIARQLGFNPVNPVAVPAETVIAVPTSTTES